MMLITGFTAVWFCLGPAFPSGSAAGTAGMGPALNGIVPAGSLLLSMADQGSTGIGGGRGMAHLGHSQSVVRYGTSRGMTKMGTGRGLSKAGTGRGMAKVGTGRGSAHLGKERWLADLGTESNAVPSLPATSGDATPPDSSFSADETKSNPPHSSEAEPCNHGSVKKRAVFKQTVQPFIEAGDILMRKGDYPGAAMNYFTAQNAEGFGGASNLRMACAHFAMERYYEGTNCLRHFVERGGSLPIDGFCMPEDQEMELRIQERVRYSPQNTDYLIGGAVYYLSRDQKEHARRNVEILRRIDPHNPCLSALERAAQGETPSRENRGSSAP
ncbi:MAG: hypothetical protein KJ645_11365 [Planctomycetes bacterium]|nr:hypothetical protein [Planctomycetota bacterium]